MAQQLASSKIIVQEETPAALAQIAAAQADTAGAVLTCAKGPIGVATLVNSLDEYYRVFGRHAAGCDGALFAEALYGEAETNAPFYVVRTVHYADPSIPASKTSARASAVLSSVAQAATSGSVTGTEAGPYALIPGDTLVGVIDGGAPATATFTATQAARESAIGPFDFTGGASLSLEINGVAQVVAFTVGEFADPSLATVQEVANVLNAKLIGASAVLSSGDTKVTIRSDRFGTASGVNVAAGGANTELTFTTGLVTGTGNVGDIAAVTQSEVKAVFEAAVAGSLVTANALTGPTFAVVATGAAHSIQITAGGTANAAIGLDTAIHAGDSGGVVDALTIEGKDDGTHPHAFQVRIENATSGRAAEYNLVILKNGYELQTFVNLSQADTADRFAELVVNGDQGSWDLRVTVESTVRPANGTSAYLSGGADGLAGLTDSDYIGAVGIGNVRTGLRCLDGKPITDVAIPARANATTQTALAAWVDARPGEVFAVLDPPAGLTAQGICDYVDASGLLEQSEQTAIYWPRVTVTNPDKTVYGNATDVVTPPSAHVIGVAFRTGKRDGGVYMAPAGVENGVLKKISGFETPETEYVEARDLVTSRRVNALTVTPNQPRHILDSMTLKSTSNFPSVSERRGVNFIEQSIKQGWERFRQRNNDARTRAEAKRLTDAFLTVEMKKGAFRTMDPSSAFMVDVGEGLNTASAIFAGKLLGRIALATQKPIRWGLITVSQDVRALTALGKAHDNGSDTRYQGRFADLLPAAPFPR